MSFKKVKILKGHNNDFSKATSLSFRALTGFSHG